MTPARRPSHGTGSRSRFGGTWWGRAWIEALEQRARLDPNRLPRGRTYARHAHVGALTVEAGEVRAPVLGSRASAYRVRVRVRLFTAGEWETVLDSIAAKAGHAAALLDGELSPEVVDDVTAAGLDLLPGAGEVGTSCSCPDWANPCKHAAAVCYLVADLLDDDPFVLLQLRGRSRDEVVAGLRARRAGGQGSSTPADGDEPDAGVVARDAWSVTERPAMPLPPSPPERPGRPAPLAVEPPDARGVRLDHVIALAADAAHRAWELATGAGDGGLALDRRADLARRAADALGSRSLDELARGAGMPARALVALATAWRHGGSAAVAVLDDQRPAPDRAAVDAGRAALVAAGHRVRVEASGDLLVSAAKARLRVDADGRWFRLERRSGTLEVTGPPDTDPVAVLEE